MKIQEFDIVRLTKAMPEHNLADGAKGTVVLDHFSAPAAYEVEFLDSEGRTIALVTLHGSDLEFVQRP